MQVDTLLLYPKNTETSTITLSGSRAPSAFFSPIPTDHILELAGARQIKRHDAMLLLALLSHKRQPDVTEVYPGQARLAALIGCNVRTVQRGLNRLAAAGLIVKRYLHDAAGQILGRCYDLANTLALLPAACASKATKKSDRAEKKSDRAIGAGSPPPPTLPGGESPGARPQEGKSPKRQICQTESESSDVAKINNSALEPAPPPVPAVAEKLIVKGMLARIAAQLAQRHGEERCRQALDALAQRRNVKQPAAWLYRCLTENWELAPATAGRPKSQRLYTPPVARAADQPDALDALPPAAHARLEQQARAQLIAEHAAPAAFVIRRSLEAGRSAHLVRLRMRALLAAQGGGAGDLNCRAGDLSRAAGACAGAGA